MSKTPKPFVEAKIVRSTPPKPVDLTHCKATYDRSRQVKVRPILAGIQITCGTRLGTLGLAYVNRTGGERMITAAHVCPTPGDTIGQPGMAEPVANVLETAPPFEGATVDVAKARVLGGVGVKDNAVFGNLVDYWIDTYEEWTTEDEEVQIEGSASGTSSGKVLHPYAVITVEGSEKTSAGIATYESQQADSGAPVIGFSDDDQAIFYGTHGGRVIIKGKNYAWFTPYGAFSNFL